MFLGVVKLERSAFIVNTHPSPGIYMVESKVQSSEAPFHIPATNSFLRQLLIGLRHRGLITAQKQLPFIKKGKV
jgi:hypothetical protein